MTGTQFSTYVRLQTKTNSTTFTDANLVLIANIIKDQIAARVVDIDEDYFGVPQTTDLANNQREYPLPSDQPNHFKKVEAVLDPTSKDANGNPIWIDIHEMDLNQYSALSGSIFARDVENDQLTFTPTTDEPKITSVFANAPGRCAYFIYRNALWIYSGTLANFVAGNNYLKLWGYEWPQDITATTLANAIDLSIDPDNVNAGIPRVLHLSWADMVVQNWNRTVDAKNKPDSYEQGIPVRFERALRTLVSENQDRSYTLTQPNGGHVYSDGFEL